MGAIISYPTTARATTERARARFFVELYSCGDACSAKEADKRWLRICELSPGMLQCAGGRAQFDRITTSMQAFLMLQAELAEADFQTKLTEKSAREESVV